MSNQLQQLSQTAGQHDDIHESGLGETIDGFHLIEVILKLHLNTLYRVTHPEHDLPMVMKVPKLGISIPPSAFSAFETEVRILSRLRGVYTPRVIAKGDLASCPYLVMEYIEGDALQQALLQAPLTVEQLTEIMIPVCKAVHELHRHNIIHLDLKPDNIRNRANGQAVILDFGSAHLTHFPDMYESQKENPPHTFAYVAPEQLHNVRNDSRSDIYALGAILYQLATGKLPFGTTNHITVRKRLFMPAIPPRAINDSIPPWLQQIILTCLHRRPDDRFTSAKQIAYALAHPNMITLSELAELTKKPGLLKIIGCWLQSRHDAFQKSTQHPHERITRVPHILVALDLEHASQELQLELRNTLRRIAQSDKHSFFTVISVFERSDLRTTEDPTDFLKTEHPTHIHRQMELRHWMQNLKIGKSRINYYVTEGNIAEEIINYAKHHVVDHIVIGARGSSTFRRFMGSVSTRVCAEAPCSVTVVRTRRDLPSKSEVDNST